MKLKENMTFETILFYKVYQYISCLGKLYINKGNWHTVDITEYIVT